eukprot:g32399.t1
MRVCASCRYILWDDDALRELVREAFPEELDVYDQYEEHIQRVDFARAAMLYLHGGLYADMDIELFQDRVEAALVASPYVESERHQNSLMASAPRHPFWLAFVQEARRRFQNRSAYRTTWQLTGPQMLDALVEKTSSSWLHVLPAELFNQAMRSPGFRSPKIIARHFCTSVWTHEMHTESMRLHQAARSGDLDQVRSALSARADLSSSDYAGLTALHHAALRGDARMVELLALLKADVSAQDKNATTPLHYAVQLSHVQVLRVLLAAQCSLEVQLLQGPFGRMHSLGFGAKDLPKPKFRSTSTVGGSEDQAARGENRSAVRAAPGLAPFPAEVTVTAAGQGEQTSEDRRRGSGATGRVYGATGSFFHTFLGRAPSPTPPAPSSSHLGLSRFSRVSRRVARENVGAMGGASSFIAMMAITGFLSASWIATKISQAIGVSDIVLCSDVNHLTEHLKKIQEKDLCHIEDYEHSNDTHADTAHRRLAGGGVYTSYEECLEKSCHAEISHECQLTPDMFTLIGHAGESGMHFDFQKAKVVGPKACVVAVLGTILPLAAGTLLTMAFQSHGAWIERMLGAAEMTEQGGSGNKDG